MSHHFQEGVGGRDESPFPKRSRGDRDESFKKGGKGGGGVHQSQPRGGGWGRLCVRQVCALLLTGIQMNQNEITKPVMVISNL